MDKQVNEEALDKFIDTIANAGDNVLKVVRQKFVDADLAFLDESRKHGLNSVGALMALSSLHATVAESMEKQVVELISDFCKPVAKEG